MSFLVREAEERIEKSKLVRIAGVINRVERRIAAGSINIR